MSEKNKWLVIVGHLECGSPCNGKPVLKTEPRGAYVAAQELSEFLQCSECGYAPLPELQPKLLERYVKFMKRKKCQAGNVVSPFGDHMTYCKCKNTAKGTTGLCYLHQYRDKIFCQCGIELPELNTVGICEICAEKTKT